MAGAAAGYRLGNTGRLPLIGLLVVVATAALGCLGPAQASASSVSAPGSRFSPPEVMTVEGSDDREDFLISDGADGTIIEDRWGGTITPGSNCRVLGAPSRVTCSRTNKINVNAMGGNDTVDGRGSRARFSVSAGSGNDVVVGGTGFLVVSRFTVGNNLRGEAGDDTLIGADRTDELDGGPDHDSLDGGKGTDDLQGGTGNDTLDGGVNPDRINGGADLDTVTYVSRSEAIVADLDGIADDGSNLDKGGECRFYSPCSRDALVDIENITGGSGPDTLTGDARTNRVLGGGGADNLYGGASNDFLDGGAGNDPVIDGGLDSDLVFDTGGGDDKLFGGASGNDTLSGGFGADDLSGGSIGDSDTAFYAERTSPLFVALDDQPNDGSSFDLSGQRFDNVLSDTENITGGSGGDVLSGNSAPNVLDGGYGADWLYGFSGDDTLRSRDYLTDNAISCGGGAFDKATADPLPLDPASIISDCETLTRY